jgi:hypothetical protein
MIMGPHCNEIDKYIMHLVNLNYILPTPKNIYISLFFDYMYNKDDDNFFFI